MAKVHPKAEEYCLPGVEVAGDRKDKRRVLTVWRKSLLFSCSGFTVFDEEGNLVFRVDNYGSGRAGEVVLMDAAGKPLLTVRRKKLSLGENWKIYNGEDAVKASTPSTPSRSSTPRPPLLTWQPAGEAAAAPPPRTRWRGRTPSVAARCTTSGGGRWPRSSGRRPSAGWDSETTCTALWCVRRPTRAWRWPSSSSSIRCSDKLKHRSL